MFRDYDELNNEETESNEDASAFINRFDTLDTRGKGEWAEQATIKEATSLDHVILVDHPENPNKSGFDCVSIDPTDSRLHIWEAKNYGKGSYLSLNNLTAWKDVENGEFREGYLRSVREVIKSVPDGSVRDVVQKSVADGNVSYHLRIGPETDFDPQLEQKIHDILPSDTNFDLQRYSHEYMNQSDTSITDYKEKDINLETEFTDVNKEDKQIEESEWVDRGIVDVSLKNIDTRDTPVNNSSDFRKVSKNEMIGGLIKLVNEIEPAIKEGADSDDFSQLDAKLGLDYQNGYRRIYDAFYGNEPIRLEKDGDTYSVINGYHRIEAAKELGIDTLPASVLEREKKEF